MASHETMTVLDEANTAAVRMMLSKLAEHEVTEVYETVGQVGPIADLAAEAMQERNIHL